MEFFNVSFLLQIQSIRNLQKLFLMLLIFAVVSCNEETTKKDSAADSSQNNSGKAIAAPLPSFFYTLKLSRNDYDTLRRVQNSHKLVFQFYYPPTYQGGSPQLIGYPMKSKNDSISRLSKILIPVDSSGETLFGREQILGDQQIRISDIRDLLNEVLGHGNSDYDYLLFTPKYDANNKHIIFVITVVGGMQFITTASRETNPSPPRNTY